MIANKSQFFSQELRFLGFTFNEQGMSPNQDALEAITNIPPPKTLKASRRFIGKTSFYRVFFPKLPEVEKPFTDMLKKDVPFVWNKEYDAAMLEIKDMIKNVARLKLPDFNKEFLLYCDASQETFAAALIQCEDDGTMRPIAFFSRRNPERKHLLPSVELELRCIVEVMKKFRVWLLGGFTRIFTDHKLLKKLIEINTDRKLYYYINCLNEYTYTLEYLPGSKNIVADCLTRVNLRKVLYPATILIRNPPFDVKELKEIELKDEKEDTALTFNYKSLEEIVNSKIEEVEERSQRGESSSVKEKEEYKDNEITERKKK
uniref:RNA-directed DNA polymerase n=1 Tax=Strongyloides papillosus TaxID=174720 RepID=A0A0N5BIV4_STREA